MRTLTARPALRWLLPLVLVLVVLGSVLVGTRANAGPTLPPRTAEQLLVDLQTAQVDGLSGTVAQSADLGIPAIPGASDGLAGKLTGLLSGSHQMRVWYSGPDKARLALVDTYAETDVITNGTDVWTYSSQDKTATHRTLSADQAKAGGRQAPSGAPSTPEEAAKAVLDAVGPSTTVTTDRTDQVIGRDVYELVLTPKTDSLVKQVTIAVDEQTHLPLRVRVFGSGSTPAFEVGYTDLTIAQPDPAMFTLTPPPGTKVTEAATPSEPKAPTAAQKKELQARKAQAEKDTTVHGTGWSTVVVTKLPADATGNDTLKGFLGQLKPVSGSWGSGRELDGTIVTAILTDDGRLAVGAVGSDVVQQALAK